MTSKKSKQTEIIGLSRDNARDSGAVNPPIYQTSTILFDTWEAYEASDKGKAYYEDYDTVDPSYGLSGTPTTSNLQNALKELEKADHCIVTNSGLSAITMTLTGLTKQGDHILVVDSVYGPTRRFCKKQLKRFGVETTFYDPLIGAGITDLIQDNTTLVYLEAPGSLTFEMQDVPAIVEAIKATNPDIVTVFDNSWATPLYYQPLSHGVDVSIQALTKYISGYSDIVMGAALFNERVAKRMYDAQLCMGSGSSPMDCYYALRGLRSMPARLATHRHNTDKVIEWLDNQAIVKNIMYPAHPSHSGYEIWQRDYSGATSLLTIELDKSYDKDTVVKAINGFGVIGIGCSWGGFESLVIYFDPKEVRNHKDRYSDNTHLRFYIGLEDPADIIADMEKAFKTLK